MIDFPFFNQWFKSASQLWKKVDISICLSISFDHIFGTIFLSIVFQRIYTD